MLGEILTYLALCFVTTFVCFSFAVRKEYKKQKQEIAEYKAIIKELQNEIKALNKRNEALMWACGHKAAKERQTKQEN